MAASLTDYDTATINITAVNDAPVVTIVPATYSATEQTNLALHGTGISVADADAGAATINLTLSVGSGTLTVVAGTTGVSAGAAGSSVLVIGTIAQLNDLLAGNLGGTITYVSASDSPPASTVFTVSLNDAGVSGTGGPQTGSDTAVINITAVNDAPILAGIEGAALAYTENAGAVVITSSLSASDVDNINLTGATVTISANYAIGQDALGFTNQLGITGSWDVITGVLTLSGTTSVANYETALRSITYTNSSDDPITLTRTISFVVNDGSVSSAPATRNIVVSPVNDAPQVFAPASISVIEDVPSVLNGFVLYDVDGGGGTETATFTVASGALSATSGGGVVVGGTANALTLTGTLSDLNTFISGNGLTFTTAPNDTSPVTLGISLNDGGNTGSGGPLSSGVTNVTLNVTPVNDAPTATIVALGFGVNEDDGYRPFGGISVSDPDAGANELAVTLDVNYGVIRLNSTTGLTFVVGANNSASMTFTGTLANLNAALASLTYRPDADFAGTDTLTLFVDDQGNTGGAAKTASDTATITVSPVNDAPVRTAGAVNNLTVLEDSGTTSLGLSGVTYGPGGGSDETSQTLTFEVTVIPDPNSFGKIYLADGTTQVTTGAYTLAEIQGMRFAPVSDATGGPSFFSYTVRDSGGTANGGVDSISESIQISITPVNDAPVLASIGNQTVNEGAMLSFTASATDADLPIQTLSYTLDAASIALGMSINSSTGVFSWTPTEAQGGLTPSVTITVTDNGTGTLTDSETFTITVGDTNIAPVLAAIGNQSVNEGATLSFTASATDADLPSQTLTIRSTPRRLRWA